MLLLLLPTSTTAVNANFSDKRILLLYSYDPAFPTSPKILRGLEAALAPARPIIDQEFLDSKRLWDATSQQNALHSLQHKYQFRPKYDLVVVADDHAMNFALAHRLLLFPDTPVVFLGVNDIQSAERVSQLPFMAGVAEVPSFAKTLQLATQLFPERRQLHVITDASVSGQADLQAIRQLQHEFVHYRFSEIDLSTLSWEELASLLNSLSNEAIVLLLSAYHDRTQAEQSFQQSLALITANTVVPVFHFWEHGIGDGVLGGYVVSHYEQGYQAGLMAKHILLGKPISSLALVTENANIPLFDYQQLQRFGVSFTTLPVNTKVINKPVTLWHLYKTEIVFMLILLLLMLLFISYLAHQNLLRKRLSEKLAKESSFLTLLMNTLPDLVWIKDPQGRYLTCNKRFEDFFGAKVQDIVEKTDTDFVAPELAAAFRAADLQVMQQGRILQIEEQVVFRSDGHTELLETLKTPVYHTQNGALMGVLGVARDITERKAAEASLRLAASVFASCAEGVVITDANQRIIDVNQSFSALTGYDKSDVVGQSPMLLQPKLQTAISFEDIKQRLRHQGSWQGEVQFRCKDGHYLAVWQTISAVRDLDNKLSHFVSVFSDISELKQQQQEIYHLALHDSLTGLPNRRYLNEQLSSYTREPANNAARFALLFLDIDNFKLVNDTLGHAEGDRVLSVITGYLKALSTPDNVIARVGGDEFVLLLPDKTPAQLEAFISQLLTQITQPIVLAGQRFTLSASIGACYFPDDGCNAKDLLRNADIAMHHAKQQGKNRCLFYNDTMATEIFARVQLEAELRQAINRNELSLVYQPQYDLTSGKISGVEALVRWHSKLLGFVPPDKMIPVAEESGLILAIGNWVLHEAVRQQQEWLQHGIDVGKVAVNVAGPQLYHGELLTEIHAVLAKFSVPASALALEITETFIMQQGTDALSQLTALHELGVEIAIDDFGTGYSSLSHLKRLPIDKIKIDKSFISDIPANTEDIAITKTIIALADSLGLQVIAEGVETPEQAGFLRRHGCCYAQGYLFSKPVPAQRIAHLLAVEPSLESDRYQRAYKK